MIAASSNTLRGRLLTSTGVAQAQTAKNFLPQRPVLLRGSRLTTVAAAAVQSDSLLATVEVGLSGW
jgi:hypothetical protein